MDESIVGESDLKRRRIEQDRSTVPVQEAFAPLRANNFIELLFVDANGDATTAKPHHPEYTHQVFEEENISFLPISHPGKVLVTVDCRDLNHEVSFSGDLSALEMQMLNEKLHVAIPTNTYACTNENVPNNNGAVTANLLPPGRLLHQFNKHVPNSAQNTNFEIWLATAKDAGASELLQRAEKIALWFIETADSVDFSDDRWEVIFLYSVHNAELTGKEPQRSFVGYMTLFSFRNPFLGTKLRVCQALVLPHMQAAGLGREMLLCVYQHLVAGREEVSELTVEDPALGFQRMRDSVDFQLLHTHFSFAQPELFRFAGPTGDSTELDNTANSLTDAAVAKALKITKPQAQFLVESIDYLRIVREVLHSFSTCAADESSADATTEATAAPATFAQDADAVLDALEAHADYKAFRLKVKRRILKNDKDLAALQPKAEMQKVLAEYFQEEVKRFQALESTAVRLGVLPRKLAYKA